jgi:hypothetical protein
MYVSASQGIFSLRSALTMMVVVLVMVAVSVQLFRVGRTIVGGWNISFGQSSAAATAPVVVQSNSDVIQPSNVIYNERMQSLVGSIERSAMATSSIGAANQRAILLPHRFDGDSAQPRQDNIHSDRRISRGRVNAVRAPIKAIRNAA